MRRRLLIPLGLGLAALPSAAAADPSASVSARVTVNIAPATSLTLSTPNVSFDSFHPDQVASIGARENPITVTARARTAHNGQAVLTVQAKDDLIDGTNRIAIENVRWSASGGGFRSGTLSRTAPQVLGSWTGSGERTGSVSFFLANRFEYPTGTYSTALVYTLTIP